MRSIRQCVQLQLYNKFKDCYRFCVLNAGEGVPNKT